MSDQTVCKNNRKIILFYFILIVFLYENVFIIKDTIFK